MTTASEISNRIFEAVLAQKLAPGARLGEQQLALLFDCSRTIVREALTHLSSRGIVRVSARRGWYVVEPTEAEAREVFEARRIIELGLLRQVQSVDKAAVRELKAHLHREQAALAGDDVGARSFLLGDFHVCLAGCLGNSLLAETLRDFTARTTLIAMLYQSSHDAAQSCAEHVRIVQALEEGDMALAESLMSEHIGSVQSALRHQTQSDPLAGLRDALQPVDKAAAPVPKGRTARSRSRPAVQDPASPEPSTYLGALL